MDFCLVGSRMNRKDKNKRKTEAVCCSVVDIWPLLFWCYTFIFNMVCLRSVQNNTSHKGFAPGFKNILRPLSIQSEWFYENTRASLKHLVKGNVTLNQLGMLFQEFEERQHNIGQRFSKISSQKKQQEKSVYSWDWEFEDRGWVRRWSTAALTPGSKRCLYFHNLLNEVCFTIS